MSRFKIINIFPRLLFIFLFLFPLTSLAQNNFSYLSNLIDNLFVSFELLAVVIFSLALIFFLWNLMIFIINPANEEKQKQGKQRMMWGIIILVVMFGIWGIIKIITSVLGISTGGEDFLFHITPR